MKITIDNKAGFCWGVVKTIDKAEESLKKAQGKKIYVLGEIIHNPKEIDRLRSIGLETITHDDFERIKDENAQIIIRAHGEPPSTYKKAEELGLNLIDATCPLVTKLQDRIRKFHLDGWQVVIYGKKEHPEVIGLNGVCNNEAIIVTSLEEALKIVDFSKKTVLFTQTTMNKSKYFEIRDALQKEVENFVEADKVKEKFLVKDSICHFVYNREDNLREFSRINDVIVFVAGRSSSNGKSLYNICKNVNSNCYFIEDISEIDLGWFKEAETIGITGATSTPQWYMEKVKSYLEESLVKV